MVNWSNWEDHCNSGKFKNHSLNLTAIELHRFRVILGIEEKWEGETDYCEDSCLIELCPDLMCQNEFYTCKFFSERKGCLLGFIEGGVDITETIEENQKHLKSNKTQIKDKEIPTNA